jgi:hypothetical protein
MSSMFWGLFRLWRGAPCQAPRGSGGRRIPNSPPRAAAPVTQDSRALAMDRDSGGSDSSGNATNTLLVAERSSPHETVRDFVRPVTRGARRTFACKTHWASRAAADPWHSYVVWHGYVVAMGCMPPDQA